MQHIVSSNPLLTDIIQKKPSPRCKVFSLPQSNCICLHYDDVRNLPSITIFKSKEKNKAI